MPIQDGGGDDIFSVRESTSNQKSIYGTYSTQPARMLIQRTTIVDNEWNQKLPTPAGKVVAIKAVPKESATLEQAQRHFDAANQDTSHALVHDFEMPGGCVLWTTGCERMPLDDDDDVEEDDEDDDDYAPSTLEMRLTRFAGMVTSPIKQDQLDERTPPRLMADRCCASPGCNAHVFWPSADAFRATCRAAGRSDDCWYADSLIHRLQLVDHLEHPRMLDLGKTFDHSDADTHRFAATCALTSDLDVLNVCEAGHIFGVASCMVQFTPGRVARTSVQEKDRSDDPDLKDDPRFSSDDPAQQLEAMFNAFPGLRGGR